VSVVIAYGSNHEFMIYHELYGATVVALCSPEFKVGPVIFRPVDRKGSPPFPTAYFTLTLGFRPVFRRRESGV
jgi:hypothetical protein